MNVPTTQDISDQIVAQLESSLSQTVPLLPKAFLRVLAKVMAGVFIMLWKYAGFIFLQLFVRDATMQQTTINGKVRRPLVEWGQLLGVPDPSPATRAEHIIGVGVTTQVGSLAAGSLLVDSGTGVVHQVISAVLLNAPLVAAKIRAVSDQNGGDGAGTVGNLEPGAVLSFASPLPNVSSDVFVSSRTVTGVDAETEDAYRARIFNRAQAKPQGGAYADYREWGEEVEGVAHIYPYTGKPGEVDVYVEVDPDVDPDGLPDGSHLTAVFNAIQLNGASGKATRRPAGAAVNVLSIGRSAFEVQISDLQLPDGVDETATKDDIAAGLDEYFRSREPFIVGLSVLPRTDRITRAALSGIVDTIVSAVGGTVNDVQLQQSTVSIQAHTLSKGEKSKLFGTPTYV